MSRSVIALATLALLAAGSAGAFAARAAHGGAASPRALAPAATTFVLTGRGYGHGVGMSQYGALGFARQGWTYDQILAYYFRGTELARVPGTRVRVLLGEARTAVTIRSTSAFAVRDAAGVTSQLEPGTLTFGPGLRVKTGPDPARPLPGPLVFSPGATPLELDGKAYRGSLETAVVDGRLRVVNVVDLEAYLAGVVPREMPSTWDAEALKAQAVVARSYALTSRRSGPFDLYDDVRSQVYGGVAAETREAIAAVAETAGIVVMHGGRVAQTFFFSTSGGRTASAADTWAGGSVPYLVSVPDPYDSISPHSSWGPLVFDAAQLGRKLGSAGRLLDVRLTVNSSNRVERVTLVGERGETTLRGAEVRIRLGLRSTWFRIGVLSLAKPAAPVTFGGAAVLTGAARNVAAPVLEQRAPGGTWTRAARPARARDGTFSVAVKPRTTTEYRLGSGTIRGAPVRVLVAPFVKLLPPTAPTAVSGISRPAFPGAAVAIQRRDGTRWTTVAQATADAAGAFSASLDLVPGTYRARLAPGRGFAPGVSPVLEVIAP